MPDTEPSSDPSTSTPATGLTPQQRARLLQRLRRGLAALSLVGAALVALPLAQLMRYQSAEVKALAARRASLDPVARAVALQRGLLAHRELAAQVLRGQARLEADRKLREGEVDARLSALSAALAGGRWELAMGEADELRTDWLQLAQQIQQRQIAAAASDEAHGLLVEQTLQVIDLVTAARRDEQAGLALLSAELPAGTLTALRALPRLAWSTTQLQHDPQALTLQRLDMLQAAVERTLRTIARRSPGNAGEAADGATMAQSAQAAAAATGAYFTLLRQQLAAASTAAAPVALQAAARNAVQAQMSLFDLAAGQADGLLAARARQVAQTRALLMGSLCLGLLVAAGLVMGLRRDLRTLADDDQRRADALAAPPASDGQSGGRQQAEALLQRLRESQPGAPDPAATTADRTTSS